MARTTKADLPLTSPSSTDPPQGRGQGGLRSAPRQQVVPQVSKRVLLTMEFLKTASQINTKTRSNSETRR